MFGFGFGRGPRRGGSFIWLFFLLIFAPELLFGLGLIYLIPIALLGVAAYGIAKYIIKQIKTKQSEPKFQKESRSFYGSADLSNAEVLNVDKKLGIYFKNNVSLPIIDDVALETSSGAYTSVDQLFLTYKGEKVVKLGEFKNEHYGMYKKITSLLVEFSKQPEKVMKSKVATPEYTKEEVLSDGQKYINKINDLNAAIPQEEITNGLYQTCDLLNKIELSKQSKQDEQKLTKLYDYYLPILTGILENYKNLQDRAIKDDEFNKVESQLIKTIMLINQALKTIYTEMHEDDYININADMDTLQSLIKKDGLDNNPFKVKE